MKTPLFRVVYTDDTIYDGGTLEAPKWKEINKKIRSIFYLLPTGDYLSIGGYEDYYHFVEVTQDMQGGSGQINREYAYLIGRGKHSVIYKINLKTASIETTITTKDDAFLKKLNPAYWR